jgi:iron complex outermembrane receptor protein
MVAGACALAMAVLPGTNARADNAAAQVSLGLGQDAASVQSEAVIVKQQRRLLKEKNSPSAVTELGSKQIGIAGVAGSASTLLRQAPSIYVYSQGLGDNAPELTVRGLRGLEIATTYDGVPMQDLLAPGGFLTNNIGSNFTLSQISDVSIYPGVAYPDKNTFGTIGGTIAYDSKRASKDAYFDVSGSVGSFGTYAEGFEANSGAFDSPLGTGDNAARVLLNYKNFQTQGFIDGTPNRENEMEFAFDKPYNDGLSKFQATVLYNTGSGLIEIEPVPVPYLNKNGLFSNYPTAENFAKQNNDFLTVILKNDTYVNDYLQVGLSTFYLGNDQQLEVYGANGLYLPAGPQNPSTAGQSTAFINNEAGFGLGGYFGPPVGGFSTTPRYDVGGVPLGIYGGGYGGYYYGTGHHYDPFKLYPVGSKGCPTAFFNAYAAIDGDGHFAPCGLQDQTSGSHSDTYGAQPRAQILLPDVYGIANTIKIGGLFAKETSPAGYTYYGALPQSPLDDAHAAGERTGGVQRSIFQGYIQDKIDFLDNTLHITPGATVEGTFSSYKGSDVFRSLASPYYLPGGRGYFNPDGSRGTNIDRYGPYKATKWDREYLPFFNISYDFDKILPALTGLQVYASTGSSALFAPVGDFGPNTAGPPPFASIVHLYEGGVKYSTGNLLLSTDYFYQKVDRDFGYYSSQTGTNFGKAVYSGSGQREFKGVEGSAIYQVTPSLQLFGNFSHLLAKYLTTGFALDTVAQEQYGVVIKGTPITGIPDWLSTFGVDYAGKNALLDADAYNVRLTGVYTGHQNTTFDLQGTGSYGNVYIPGVPGVDYSGGLHSDNVYDTLTGATTYDPRGGISPFAVFNLDASYTLPTPTMPILKKVTFDLNIQNLFDNHYFQYFFKQISPSSSGCPISKNDPTGNIYGCTPQFADGIPGEPFSVFFTVTARF